MNRLPRAKEAAEPHGPAVTDGAPGRIHPPESHPFRTRARPATEQTLARRTLLSDHSPVNGQEFIERVSALGRRSSVPVRLDAKRGKGSHVILYYGDRKTVVKDRRKDIGPGLLAAMTRQLGLDPGDLR